LARASPHPALEVDSSLEVAHGLVVAPTVRDPPSAQATEPKVASIGATV